MEDLIVKGARQVNALVPEITTAEAARSSTNLYWEAARSAFSRMFCSLAAVAVGVSVLPTPSSAHQYGPVGGGGRVGGL